MKRPLSCACLLPALLAACSSGGSDTADDALEVTYAKCVPNTFRECSTDQLSKVACNALGDQWEVVVCGTNSICLQDLADCSACIPGSARCREDRYIEECNATGTGYAQIQDCNGSDTGMICQSGVCANMCELNAKIESYIGCEYWGADLDNAFVPGGEQGFLDAAGSQYAIVVSNTSERFSARVQIFTADGELTQDSFGQPLPTDPIPPMSLRIFNISRAASLSFPLAVDYSINGSTIAPLAFRVVSSIPITAYQFNPLDNVGVFSNDATLLLPSNALGKRYMVMTREQTFDELRGFLTVIATQPGQTQVTVTVTAPTLGSDTVPALEEGGSHAFILDQFEVLNIETARPGADLTGSVIYSNRPIAVWGGSEAANAPNTNHCCPSGRCLQNQASLACIDRNDCWCEWPFANGGFEVSCHSTLDCIAYNTCCADHLEMQLFPIHTWGREYVATRSYPRADEQEVWRIMAAQASTQVNTFPAQVPAAILDAGQYVDFESLEHFEITATGPVMVGQFLSAQDAPGPNTGGVTQPGDAATGDPTFILLSPAEQFRDNYVFLTPNQYAIDGVNLIVPTGAAVYLDGQQLRQEDLTFRNVRQILQDMADAEIDDPAQLGVQFGDYAMIGSGRWSVWRVLVSDGVHVAQSDQPFGAVVYGYDRYVSYGYPAGLNLEDLKLLDDEP